VAALALASAIALAGCSSDNGDDWLNLLQAARASWENRDAPVKLNDAAAIPFATLGIRVDGGHEQILILAVDTNGERLWTSSASVAITTLHGRITRTAGFTTDLSGYIANSRTLEDWSQPHRYAWSADFADLGFYSVPIVCEVAPGGPDPVEILGSRIDTLRVDEACRSEKLDWSFQNSYWVSRTTGRVWRSIQHVHPKGPTLEIELLRPPLSTG
jgi:hypothetical protein